MRRNLPRNLVDYNQGNPDLPDLSHGVKLRVTFSGDIMYQIINRVTKATRFVAAKTHEEASKWCGVNEEVNGLYVIRFK